MAVVFLQTPLRRFIGGQSSVEAPGRTLRELIDNLEARYPGIKEHLVNPEESGKLALGLAAVVDGEPTNMGLLTALDESSEVHFLPAIAGGAPFSSPPSTESAPFLPLPSAGED